MKTIKALSSQQQVASSKTRHQRIGWWLTGFLIVLYLVSFPFMLPVVGEIYTSFTCLPVMAAAWFLGRRPAFLISLIITIGSFILTRALIPGIPLLQQINLTIFGFTVLLVLGYFIGWSSEMRLKLQYDLTDRKQMETVIKESEQRYRMLFQDANDPIIIHDLEGNFLELNQTALKSLGYGVESIADINLISSKDHEYTELLKQFVTVQKQGQLIFETVFLDKAGQEVPVEVNARLISYRGKPAILSAVRDITQRKAIERAEREQRIFAEALRNIAANLTGTLRLEEVLDRILDNLSEVVSYDSSTIMLVDGAAAYVTRHRGYDERGHLEKIHDLRFSIEQLPTLLMMAQTRKPLVIENVRTEPNWVSHPSTDWIASYAGAPIHLKGTVIGFLNIESATPGRFTQEQASRMQAFADHAAIAIHNARLYEEVQNMALVDELTKVYNRRGLVEIGQREVDRSRRFGSSLAVLMIDIDHFKQFNSYYSHIVGDEVLAIFAQRCKSSVRKVDLVCRYGGDEFVILLTENTIQTAARIAENLRRAIEEQPFATSRGPVQVTASFGVAALKGEACDLNTLTSAAAEALQQAKQQGRNRVFGSE